jgi:hypothetical protein
MFQKVKIKAKTESSIGQPIYGHKDKEDISLYICGRKKKKKKGMLNIHD